MDRAEEPFLVFDAMLFKGKPDLSPFGLRRLNIIYGSSFWPYGVDQSEPTENAIRTLARNAARRGQLVCVDIEHWHIWNQPDEVAHASIRKYRRVASVMHHAEPGLRLGFYGVLPIRPYNSPVQAGRPHWRELNERLREVAEHVDVVFPSLYTLTTDPEQWVRHAQANFEEARRYGKQVYPFLWPAYHSLLEAKAGQPIPASFWRLQLETCRQYADGLVIWSPPEPWDEQAPWWIETQQFLEQLNAEQAAAQTDG